MERLLVLVQSEFDWTSDTIGIVDSSFFWGYIATQIPGGFLAARYPANRFVPGTLDCSLHASACVHAPCTAYHQRSASDLPSDSSTAPFHSFAVDTDVTAAADRHTPWQRTECSGQRSQHQPS